MTDSKLELMISKVLRAGVMLAGAVVFVGGVYYLAAHGGELVNYRTFTPQAETDTRSHKIIAGAFALRPRSIIQFGVLLLIATPIVRVAVSLAGFAMERDRQYVVIAAIVLLLLLYSLVSGSV